MALSTERAYERKESDNIQREKELPSPSSRERPLVWTGAPANRVKQSQVRVYQGTLRRHVPSDRRRGCCPRRTCLAGEGTKVGGEIRGRERCIEQATADRSTAHGMAEQQIRGGGALGRQRREKRQRTKKTSLLLAEFRLGHQSGPRHVLVRLPGAGRQATTRAGEAFCPGIDKAAAAMGDRLTGPDLLPPPLPRSHSSPRSSRLFPPSNYCAAFRREICFPQHPSPSLRRRCCGQLARLPPFFSRALPLRRKGTK